MTKIIVDKKELETRLAQAGNEDLIELRIVPLQDDGGNVSPAFLHLAAIHNSHEYDDLEGVD